MSPSHNPRVVIEGAAIVTGAARGIGFDIARSLAADGRAVVLLDVLEEVHTAAKTIGDQVMSIQVDLTDEGGVVTAVRRVREAHGTISALINNAGISGRKGGSKTPVHETNPESWFRVLDTNLTSTFLLCKACIPAMADQKFGRIVNMASQAGRARSEKPNADYAASKAAIIGFSRGLALEVASQGITVNCIAPGRISTPMTASMGAEFDELYSEKAALGKVGQPADITAAVRYLVSTEAGFMTGAIVDVNGGWSMN